ncbi:hypothetical protein [Paenibacillus sp. TC-CSREp1]
MNEFFLLRNYRGRGVGEEAMRQIIGSSRAMGIANKSHRTKRMSETLLA